MYCNQDLDALIRTENYDTLVSLTPPQRAAELFRLEIERLELELGDDDRLFGFFGLSQKPELGETPAFPEERPSPEDAACMTLVGKYGGSVDAGKSHTLVDYGYILQNGLKAYSETLERLWPEAPEGSYPAAMKSELRTVRRLMERLRDYLSAYEGKNPYAPVLLEAVRRVPWEPAETFLQALESIWIVHFLLPLAENGWYSISLGRLDVFLAPYYEKALAEGQTDEELVPILHTFWKLLNSYSDGACLMNIGPDYTPLSMLLLRCQKEFSMAAPILGARVRRDTPSEIYAALIDEALFSRGQPTFYSEENCIRALRNRGIPEASLCRFSNNSCMGIGLPGEEYDSMWGMVTNVTSILEEAVKTAPDSSEALRSAFTAEAKRQLSEYRAAFRKAIALAEQANPDPFLSVLTAGCMEKGQDRYSAARYFNVTVECFGMINAADGLTAIEKLVWKQKKYALSDLKAAMEADWEGYEQVRAEILACPKFGRDSAGSETAQWVASVMADAISAQNEENFRYCPSLHTLTSNVFRGAQWHASYDGRRSGEPYAKNAGPADAQRTGVPTDTVMACGALPQTRFHGGQPIDLHFTPDTVEHHKDAIAALIRTYFAGEGLQLQVNSLCADTLQKAYDDPEAYRDLVVRVGGYSAQFYWFSNELKQEFIARFRREEG